MKKSGVLLLLFVLLTAFMCEDEPIDDGTLGDANTNSAIVGDWELQSLTYNGTSETTFQGQTITQTFEGNSQNEDYMISFNENGTFDANGSYNIVLDVTTLGITQSLTNNLSSNSSGTYSANETTLTTSGGLVSVSTDGVTDTVSDVETTSEYTLSDDGQTLTLTSEDTQNINQNGIVSTATVNSTTVLVRSNNGGGGGGGGGQDNCDQDYIDQTAQGNFKGADFTIEGGTHRVLGNGYFCRIYVSELIGGDCAFPEFGGNEARILFSLDNLNAQTITLSDVAGEGESLNFNSLIDSNVTDAELAVCGQLEILSSDATTVNGRVWAVGQQGSTINGNFTLTLCEE